MTTKAHIQRTHIVIPQPLVEAIDRFIGKRGRSHFIAQAAERELKRHRLIAALKNATGAWADKDHRELSRGSMPYVERLRQESDRKRTAA